MIIMTNNLTLITTETFGDLPCNFYRNINNDILLTREQIGTALEYRCPDDALSKIHKRHSDRLDTLSVVAKLSSTDGKAYDTFFYTQRGVMEICRWSRQPKANEFMDWVWDIIEKYRNNELLPSQQVNMQPIIDTLTSITQSLSTLTSNIVLMQQEIQKFKQEQNNRYLQNNHYPSAWYKKILPKYKMLMSYFDCTRSELYSSIYKELEDTYNIDINQIHEDYCYENHLLKNECYPMDAIEHNEKLRDALTLLIDSSLIKYGLQTENELKNFKRKTLFDQEPKNN